MNKKFLIPILVICLLGGAIFCILALSSQPAPRPVDAIATEQPAQPSMQQPETDLDERITQVENGLVGMDANGQPLRCTTAALTDRMADYQAPGLSIAVIDAYQISWVKGYGVRVAGGDDTVTAQTLFHAGSVAKALSAAAALTLVEQGLFGLGVELQNTSQGLKVWHTGGTWGSCSIIWFYPELGKGAVVMVNSASGSLLRYEILLSIAAAYDWPMD